MKTKKIISWAVALCMGVMLNKKDLIRKKKFQKVKKK